MSLKTFDGPDIVERGHGVQQQGLPTPLVHASLGTYALTKDGSQKRVKDTGENGGH